MALLDIPHSVVAFNMQFLVTGYEHSLMLETTRIYRAKIADHSQVSDDLDQCGFSASKLWNVARYYTQGRWDEDGEILDDGELKSELKEHERYSDLHSQSTQRVLEELSRSPVGTKHANAEMRTPTHPAIANTATNTRAPP